MKNSLVIGQNSQLSKYFPDKFERISSRNVNIPENDYNKIFLTFAEQRTFDKSLDEKDFVDVNVDYTSKIIEQSITKAELVIIYGTSELWNNCEGPINLNTPMDFSYTPYIKSKEILNEKLQNMREKNNWENVIIIHPFNFNSIHRREGFLFRKLYDSIIFGRNHEVGNINIFRDIIHAKYVVDKSKNSEKDIIVGSGKLINIRDFFKDVFGYYGLNMSDFIEEKDLFFQNRSNQFWYETNEIYQDLLIDTIQEINNYYENKIG